METNWSQRGSSGTSFRAHSSAQQSLGHQVKEKEGATHSGGTTDLWAHLTIHTFFD